MENNGHKRRVRYKGTHPRTYEEKYKLLCDLRSDIDDRLINDLSVALDIAVDNGPVDKRYEQLKSALATLCKYEVHRLR